MANWRPTQRLDADQAWFLMVSSFGVSVVGTRVYLEATGYPQIGSGVLHIAHVLWGGLLLFLSICIFLTYGNRWKYSIGAVLGGAGAGLFIDEVGKFITQSNDYFFPFAAPIIYGFFLLTAFVYLQIKRRRPPSVRSDLYWALDQLKDVADHDFDTNEHAAIEQALARALQHSRDVEERQVIQAMLDFAQALPLIDPPPPGIVQRSLKALAAFESRWISRRLHKGLLIAWFLIVSLSGLAVVALEITLAGDSSVRAQVVSSIINEGTVSSPVGFQWLLIHATLTGIVGILFLTGGILLVRWESTGINIGQFALLLQLTVVNLLAFYFNQFTMISSTLVALVLLLAVVRYRRRFLSTAA